MPRRKSLKPQIHEEVLAALADFRTLLELTVNAENAAYETPQYSFSDVKSALASAIDGAKPHILRELAQGPLIPVVSLDRCFLLGCVCSFPHKFRAMLQVVQAPPTGAPSRIKQVLGSGVVRL